MNETSSIKEETTMGSSCQNLFDALRTHITFLHLFVFEKKLAFIVKRYLQEITFQIGMIDLQLLRKNVVAFEIGNAFHSFSSLCSSLSKVLDIWPKIGVV